MGFVVHAHAPRARAAEDVPCPDAYNTPATACPLSDGAVVHGVLTDSSRVEFFTFTTDVPATHARITVSELPADYDLYLGDATSNLVASSVQDGLTPELIDADLPTAGLFFIYVVADPSVQPDPDQPYRLDLALQAPQAPASAPTPPPPAPATPPPPVEPMPTPAVAPPPGPSGVGVPNLAGKSAESAQATLSARGLRSTTRPADIYGPVGTVVGQTPGPGTTLPSGGTVSLLVATGRVEVPDVAGRTEDEAARILGASGFHTTTTRRRSDKVPQGLALGSNPGVGAIRPAGTTVAIILSQGP